MLVTELQNHTQHRHYLHPGIRSSADSPDEESVMQQFHQQTDSSPTEEINALYKTRILPALKSAHKRSDYPGIGNTTELWSDKYYNSTVPSPPPLIPHPTSFNYINQTKPYHSTRTSTALDSQNGSLYTNNPYNTYQAPVKNSYYPSSLSAAAAVATNNQTSNMFQWQQTLHQQQASQQLHQRLGGHQHTLTSSNHENMVGSHHTNSRFDMFLRSQHPANYLLSFNDTSSNWCQTTNQNKSTTDSLFQPQVAKNICPLCGKNYARPSTLKTHMRIHSGERPFHCKVCNKSFSQAANLTAHLRVHSGEKPFSCNICNKTFSQSSSVTTHMRTHSGDRPYKCPICRKGFSDSSTLTKHLRIHSGEKPYRCNYCSMSFSQSGNLNRHMKVHEHSRKPDSSSSSKQPSP